MLVNENAYLRNLIYHGFYQTFCFENNPLYSVSFIVLYTEDFDMCHYVGFANQVTYVCSQVWPTGFPNNQPHIKLHTYTKLHLHMYIQIHIRISMPPSTHTHAAPTHPPMHARTHMNAHTHHTHTCKCTHIQTHTHQYTLPDTHNNTNKGGSVDGAGGSRAPPHFTDLN